MRKKSILILTVIALVISLLPANTFAAKKGKYNLPTKAITYQMVNGKWKKISTNKIRYNKYGDIISVSNYSGEAKTTYWEGTKIRKEVVWYGRGGNKPDVLTFDKKGRLIRNSTPYFDEDYSTSKGWIDQRDWMKIKRSFYRNGMIKKTECVGEKVVYNKRGLVKSVKRNDSLAPWEKCRYKYSKNGNVKSVRVTQGGGSTYVVELKTVFKYDKKYKVSKRTHAAWINELGASACDLVVFDDILAL